MRTNQIVLANPIFQALKRSGVRFRRRTFSHVQSFANLAENIIISCTGYGAKALLQDDQMLARRGHLVVLTRTLAKQFYFFSGGCANYRTMYVFCRQRDIVIGGSVQDGNESELASSDDDRIPSNIENARNVFDGCPRQCE
jgi:D-amino-acid oxidase